MTHPRSLFIISVDKRDHAGEVRYWHGRPHVFWSKEPESKMEHTNLEAIMERQRRGYRGEDPIQVHIDCAGLLADLYDVRNKLNCAENTHPADEAAALRRAFLHPRPKMTYSDALRAAHLVKDIPGAARAVLNAWLKAAEVEPLVEPGEGYAGENEVAELNLLRKAGYVLTPAQETHYLQSWAVGIQHRDDIALVWDYPWALPPELDDNDR